MSQSHNLKTRLNSYFYGLILFISDLIILSFCCFFSYYLRFFARFFGSTKPTYILENRYIFYSAIFIGSVILVLLIIRLYELKIIYLDPVYYFKLLAPPVAGMVVMTLTGKFYENFPFSRLWILALLVTSILLLVFSRFVIAILTRKIFRKAGIRDFYISAGFDENIGALKYLSRFKKKIVYGVSLLISDVFFLAISFYLSYYLRFKTGELAEINKTYIIERNYISYSILFIASALFIFLLYNLYDKDKIYRGSGYYTRLLKAVSINIIVIILTGYVLDLFTFSRKWILLLFLFSVVLIYMSRYIIEFMTQRILKKLNIITRTVIVGIGENAKRIENSLKKYSHEDAIILGHVDKKQRISKKDEYTKNLTILGHLEDLQQIICENNVQRIIISSPEFKYFEILEMLESLKGMDLTILIFPGFFEFSLRRLSFREIGGVPLMQVSNIGFFGVNLFLKNLIDYVLGIISFVIFTPIYLFVGMLIKMDSRGPVFFEQKRMTKDCKVFYMYKFRTMHVGAAERLEELAKYNEADGPLFKIKNDPRVTKVGRFLRRFSIDELPQIINVLKGEMSLVGPRPPLPNEVEKYTEWEMKRMNVKQGMTGLWQISGRSDLSFEEMSHLDLYYIQNWSIEIDIKIILKTIPAMLFRKGAY